MPSVPSWTNDTSIENAAKTVNGYGQDLQVGWFFNLTATAIAAGDAVMFDVVTAIPTTGAMRANVKRGNCVAKADVAASTGKFCGIALEAIPATSALPGPVIIKGSVSGSVGANVAASLSAGAPLQMSATAGRLGAHSLDTTNDVAVILVATGVGENFGHIHIY